MPHLQDESVEKHSQNEGGSGAVGSSNSGGLDSVSRADLPIQEARKGYLGTSDPGVTALAEKVSAAANQVESFESTESTEANACSTPANRTSKPVITPSSSASNAGLASPIRSSSSDGPILTVYGSNSIFSSPISVKRRVSQSEEDDEDEKIILSQQTHLRYGGPQVVTASHYVGKRCVSSDQDHCSGNNSRNVEVSSAKKIKSNGEDVSASIVGGKVPSDSGVAKKRIISPTSAREKGDNDDHTESSGQKYRNLARYEHNLHSQGVAHYPPHPASFAFGGPPPYGAGYPIYHTYAPHGVPHVSPFMTGHLHGHPGATAFFSPYHHAAAHAMQHYRHTHHRFAGAMPQKEDVAPRVRSSEGSGNKESFKSVAHWQQATLSSGKPPSANRCMPLKEPIPSKYWGEADKTSNMVLPDFHRLVNYPDYLTKSRNGSSDVPSSGSGCFDGKRNCVMCGELRISSATSLINKGRAPKADEFSGVSDVDGECAHIIPRQNKGLCTACDVTVWIVVGDGMEIKWCKGCKNFRPWAAFGDKGGATKCVRCRDRQREKYALQKDVVRPRKYKVGGSSSSLSSSSSVEEKKEEESHLADAARGLRNLMKAAATAV